jgi:tetratricopeptide (TPR) repeat protein
VQSIERSDSTRHQGPYMKAATRADPTFADAWYNLSDLLDEQGRVEAAIECLRTVLRVAPDYADAMFNLALLLQRTNQYAEATGYWRRYLGSDCKSEWAARARLHEVRPGAWLISPYTGWNWAKWPSGDVGWLPSDVKLPPCLRVLARNDVQ